MNEDRKKRKKNASLFSGSDAGITKQKNPLLFREALFLNHGEITSSWLLMGVLHKETSAESVGFVFWGL